MARESSDAKKTKHAAGLQTSAVDDDGFPRLDSWEQGSAGGQAGEIFAEHVHRASGAASGAPAAVEYRRRSLLQILPSQQLETPAVPVEGY